MPDKSEHHNQGDDQMDRIKFYYSAGYDSVESHFRRAQIPETILRDFYRDDMDSVIWTKEEAENYLAAQNRLYTNITDVIEALLSGKRSLYASLHIDDVEYTYMNRWEPYGVNKIYHYGCEEINMQIWFTRYLTNLPWRESYKDDGDEYHLGHERLKSLDFFGRIVCGDDCHRIDAVPVFMTNMIE